jgi:hypothetical protein
MFVVYVPRKIKERCCSDSLQIERGAIGLAGHAELTAQGLHRCSRRHGVEPQEVPIDEGLLGGVF